MTVAAAESPEAALAALAERAGGGPVFLHILVADRCNHACQHCYQLQGRKGELTLEQILEILEQFRRGGGFVVSLSGGEATLRADLLEILDCARRLGLATVLYTNGYLVTARLAAELRRVGVWRVDVSIYSDRADEHDALTRVPGSWLRTLQAIRLLRDERVNVRLKFTPTRPSSATVDRMRALAAELDCAIAFGEQVNAREDGSLAPLAAARDPRAAAELAAEDARGREDRAAVLARAPCTAGRDALTLRSDGVLQPCTNVEVPIGTPLAGADIASLVRTSEVSAFFRGVTWSDLHGCRDCDLVTDCGRCFATALAQGGDMLGPYPAACAVAVARHAARTRDHRMHAPEAECGADRDASVGPYRIEPDGSLLPIADRVLDSDRALALRYPWLRAPARAEKLVQLRRRAAALDPADHGS